VHDPTTWEARARTAEARVEELASERARLWEELQTLRAERAAVDHYQATVRKMEETASWRVTRPLRFAKRVLHKLRELIAERR
jgi:uncharacterized protein (DUF3084 family)